jgi:hypothetical protein
MGMARVVWGLGEPKHIRSAMIYTYVKLNLKQMRRGGSPNYSFHSCSLISCFIFLKMWHILLKILPSSFIYLFIYYFKNTSWIFCYYHKFKAPISKTVPIDSPFEIFSPNGETYSLFLMLGEGFLRFWSYSYWYFLLTFGQLAFLPPSVYPDPPLHLTLQKSKNVSYDSYLVLIT